MEQPKDNLVEPGRLLGRPMTLRKTWLDSENDFVARIVGLTVASIHLVTRANSVQSWNWSITGPMLPREQYPHNGMADTLDEAKAIVKEKYDRWLAWALPRSGLQLWMGADSSMGID